MNCRRLSNCLDWSGLDVYLVLEASCRSANRQFPSYILCVCYCNLKSSFSPGLSPFNKEIAQLQRWRGEIFRSTFSFSVLPFFSPSHLPIRSSPSSKGGEIKVFYLTKCYPFSSFLFPTRGYLHGKSPESGDTDGAWLGLVLLSAADDRCLQIRIIVSAL